MDVSALLNASIMGHAAWLWLAFAGVVVALLAFDLGVLNKNDHVISLRESLLLSSGYIGVALLFGTLVWWQLGAPSGTAYLTGFLIEKLLSIDNVYVIALIFTYLAIPANYQHRVLFIAGALVMRRRHDRRGRCTHQRTQLDTLCVWRIFGIHGFQNVVLGKALSRYYEKRNVRLSV